MKCANGNERFTVYLDEDSFRMLKEYAFCEDIRSPNTAAREIVTDFLRSWDEVVNKGN